MSYTSTEQQIITRVKRREITFRILGVFIGVVSFIALLSVVIIAIRKYHRTQPKLEEDYITKNYGTDGRGIPRTPIVHNEITGKPQTITDRRSYDDRGAIDFTRSIKDNPKSPSRVGEGKETGRDSEAVTQGSSGIENIEAKQTAIAATVKEFFEARSITEVLPLVRDARRVRPLMEEYYARQPFVKRQWKSMGWAMPVEEPGYRFAYVQALFEEAPPVHVVVEESDSGFLVDWESSVHYSEMSWSNFQSQKPLEPKMFRVLASRPDETEGLRSENQQTTLKLKHPQEDGVIYAHFETNDPRFRPLLQQLDLCKWKDVPLILRLCYPGPTAAKTNEVDIASVEGKGWLFLKSTPRG